MTNVFEETRRSQDSLRTLAAETGGIAAVDRNDFTATFGRIIRDNSNYYVLGYYSTERQARRPVPEGGRQGAAARRDRPRPQRLHRAEGRRAPKKSAATPQASAALQEALDSPIPVSGLALTAAAVPFRVGRQGVGARSSPRSTDRALRSAEKERPALERRRARGVAGRRRGTADGGHARRAVDHAAPADPRSDRRERRASARGVSTWRPAAIS